ncbi:MAG: CoA pyrophosphatase [Bradymonadaceae bacterium]|nr:CoA pyrophosphatase [Lujinxingiaceae bacterium]
MSAGDRFAPASVRKRLRQLNLEPHHVWLDRHVLEHAELTDAAVLMALTEQDEEMHLVLTKRAIGLREHSGEISFPGGRADLEDPSLLHTALREASEEIALAPSHVEVYGALLSLPTITGYRVSTFVGEFVQPYTLIANPHEIDTLIIAPLRALADERIYRLEDREFMGVTYPIHFYDYEGHVIWGATGFMLHLFLQYLSAS